MSRDGAGLYTGFSVQVRYQTRSASLEPVSERGHGDVAP